MSAVEPACSLWICVPGMAASTHRNTSGWVTLSVHQPGVIESAFVTYLRYRLTSVWETQ
jgi:hypothetical protein